ncbi:ATP-dependent DNA helicase [Nesterenkonia sphaerica]|uniref:DNA 3'-5' helicase n=1 Tax=Nesterenkonia sphaerica TaxID=1804988 RepID=A0A5R9AEM0_9MICC|nr:ATP-dependent DNA helicase [Nesterenkonia sphaerica]TLP77212.1 ATP-dependent helicase [Nesterenkonia sphaerica]
MDTQAQLTEERGSEIPLAPSCPTLVYGAPGAGKTGAAVESALDFLRTGEDSRHLLVLSPTRDASARLRDEIEARWGAESPEAALSEQPSRSFASYAFWVLGEARRRNMLRFAAQRPRLLSGAEQDRIIGDILQQMAGEGVIDRWPESLREATHAAGFRREVRELLDRAREYGVTASWLERAAQAQHIPEWRAAAEVYSRYLERFSSAEFEDAYDPAGLISEAGRLLEENPELLDAERRRLLRIVVDDLHEASPSVYRMLRLIGAGRPVLAMANPDTVTQGFRGARPDRLKGWTELMAPDPARGLHGTDPEIHLLTGHHMSGPVAQVYAKVAQRIAAPAETALRRMWQPYLHGEAGGSDPDGSAEAVTAVSAHAAERAVLTEILRRHDHQRVRFSQIAVIARSGSGARRISRALAAHGVPVRQSMRDVVLHQEPAVAPLLTLLSWSGREPHPGGFSLSEVLELLDSRYGLADPLRLRGVRQQLRSQERQLASAEGRQVRSSDELILAAAHDPQDPVLRAVAAPARGSRAENSAYGLRRIALMLGAVGSAGTHSAPGELLWQIWDAAGLAEPWREATKHTGWEAERADRDLDAVLALFHAAERYEQQNPTGSAADFAQHLQRLELPMDTLAQTTSADEGVEVLTPTTAAGRHFDTVIVLDLQQGIWPNLQPRGQLLRSQELADVVEGHSSVASRSVMVKRIQTLQDEYRLFASALSRATNRLFAVAVETQEERPSALLSLITAAEDRPAPSEADSRPLTEVTFVAELRRALEDDPTDLHAAQALAALARHHITGASPSTWWGLPQLSTTEPVHPPEDELRVSPSSVETAITQPLEWFIKRVGGTEPTDFSRQLGTLIHSIAEQHPEETEVEKLHQVLDARWHELRLQGWEADAEKARAREMLRQLARYHVGVGNRELIGTEIQATAGAEAADSEREGPVIITGVIDRIEREHGKLHIIDLKTGRKAPTRDAAKRHPQLGLYQLLAAGDPALSGLGQLERAALLYVAANQNPTVRDQDAAPLEAPSAWPVQQLREAVHVMTQPSFVARIAADAGSGRWNTCRVGPLCPLCEESRQVTQP